MRGNVWSALALAGAVLLVSGSAIADPWNGSQLGSGVIWRNGPVVIGTDNPDQGDGAALLRVQRQLSGDSLLLFSAGATFQEQFSNRFEVDTLRAYAGGSRSKSDLLPNDVDLAVHRKLVVGLNSIDEDVPDGYSLVIGGGILATELRIKEVSDWPDRVFADDYALPPLSAVETFIRANRHLPNVPSAREAESAGVEVGAMQSTLLLKIEELTLYAIDQQKTIADLQRRLAELEARLAAPQAQP